MHTVSCNQYNMLMLTRSEYAGTRQVMLVGTLRLTTGQFTPPTDAVVVSENPFPVIVKTIPPG